MRRVFIDVGSHDGQTLNEVTRRRWGFDLILGLEPMPEQFANSSDRFAHLRHVHVFNYGLADTTGPMALYGDNGDLGSSIFVNKRRAATDNKITVCQMREASAFFREFIYADDLVVMKLNCEGAEVVILNNLIDSGEISKVARIMIDFDIRKVPGQEYQAEAVLDRFERIGYTNYALSTDVMQGRSHAMRIATWLKSAGLVNSTPTFSFLGDLSNWMVYVSSRPSAAARMARRICRSRLTKG